MDTTDILRGAFQRAREREEAARRADRPTDNPGASPGRDSEGRVLRKSDKAEPQTKEEKIAAIEAELSRLARERGVAHTSPERSRMAKLIASKHLGS